MMGSVGNTSSSKFLNSNEVQSLPLGSEISVAHKSALSKDFNLETTFKLVDFTPAGYSAPIRMWQYVSGDSWSGFDARQTYDQFWKNNKTQITLKKRGK